MKKYTLFLFFVLLQIFTISGGQNYQHQKEESLSSLIDPSEHGHETGLVAKGKRCKEIPKYPFQGLLGSMRDPKNLPLRRRNAMLDRAKQDSMVLDSRFNKDPILHTSGLAEFQDRYYTVGSLGPGPRQAVVAKILGIPPSIQLERLVILAKNRDVSTETSIVRPVVIDTAHVFTTNMGKPAQLELEVHNVGNNDESEDINRLISLLNKDLDTAIVTKKDMMDDSHLSSEEIDKIIEHVVEQMQKKFSRNNPKVSKNRSGQSSEEGISSEETGSTTMIEETESTTMLTSASTVSSSSTIPETTDELFTELPPLSSTDINDLGNDVLGHKKVKKLLIKKNKKGHNNINNNGNYYRSNEDLEDATELPPISSTDINNLGNDVLGHKKFKKLMKKKNKKGHNNNNDNYGNYYRSNEDLEDAKSPEVIDFTPEEDSVKALMKRMKALKESKFDNNDLSSDNKVTVTSRTITTALPSDLLTTANDVLTERSSIETNQNQNSFKQSGNDESNDVVTPASSTTESPFPPTINDDADHVWDSVHPEGKWRSQQEVKYQNPNQLEPEYQNPYQKEYGYQTPYQQGPYPNPQIPKEPFEIPQSPPTSYKEEPHQQPNYLENREAETYHATMPPYRRPLSASQYQSGDTYQKPEYQNYPPAQYQPSNYPSAYPKPQENTYQEIPQRPINYPYQQPQETYGQRFQEQQPQEAYAAQPQAAYGKHPQSGYIQDTDEDDEPEYERQPQYAPLDEPQYGPNEYVGKQKEDIPDDQKSRANWFENEYNRLKSLLDERAERSRDLPLSGQTQGNQDLIEEGNQNVVRDFTKVIEDDLTDGQKLSPNDERQLNRRISKLIEDGIKSKDSAAMKERMEKNLNDLEQIVQDDTQNSADEKIDDDEDTESASHFETTGTPVLSPLKTVENLRNKIKESLDNLRNPVIGKNLGRESSSGKMRVSQEDAATEASTSTTHQSTKKSNFLGIKKWVDDLVPTSLFGNHVKTTTQKAEEITVTTPSMIQRIANSPSKVPDKKISKNNKPEKLKDENVSEEPVFDDVREIVKPTNEDPDEDPQFIDERTKSNKNDQTLGSFNDEEQDGLDYEKLFKINSKSDLEKTDKKETFLEKLLKPHHMRKSTDLLPQRSDAKHQTLPEIIKNFEKNLHLPTFPPLFNPNANNQPQQINLPEEPEDNPLMDQSMPLIGPNFVPSQQRHYQPSLLPQGYQRDYRPMEYPPPPQQYEMPMQQYQPYPQEMMMQPQALLGTPQDFSGAQQANHELNHFGKIVPEAVHDRMTRDAEMGRVKRQKMYFVGDGIKLPLHMHKHKDGTLHLSVDLQKLCKCNATNCLESNIVEPDFIATNSLGKATKEIKENQRTEDVADEDLGDAPLSLSDSKTDIHITGKNLKEAKRTRRSPRFDFLNNDRPWDDEKLDTLTKVNLGSIGTPNKEQMVAFNKDLEEYYKNEVKLQDQMLSPKELDTAVQKRIGLLSNLMYWLKGMTIEHEPNLFEV